MRRLSRIVPVALLLVALLPVIAPMTRVRAADITFGVPEATASYGESIVFTVPFTTDGSVERIELRLYYPGAVGPHIVDVPVPAGGGAQPLRYALDLAQGGLVPNTTIRATWAAVTDAGEVITSGESAVRYEDTSRDWQTLPGDVVTVHWYEGDRTFGERALEIAETAIRDTSSLLGVEETEPVDFFIYGDEEAFRTALGPGTREWVAGTSIAEIRTLFGLLGPDQINDSWVDVLVTHELAHLVIDTATQNPYRGPPRWLHEGLATYLSEGYTASWRASLEAAVKARELLPLDAMGGQLPTDADKAGVAYAETVSAVDYLVRTYGRDALVSLIGTYRQGLTDDEVFTQAIGVDVAGFQAGWLEELGAETPERYGPQPAPAGPLPGGWEAPGQTAGPVATPATPPNDVLVGGSTDDNPRGVIVLAAVTLGLVGAAGALVARRRRAGA